MKRKTFNRIASDLTGLSPRSVNAIVKIERNRDNLGRFAPGYKYVVESKRSRVTVEAVRG